MVKKVTPYQRWVQRDDEKRHGKGYAKATRDIAFEQQYGSRTPEPRSTETETEEEA